MTDQALAEEPTIENLDSILEGDDLPETQVEQEPESVEEETTEGDTEEQSEDAETPSAEENKSVPMSAFMGVKDELKQTKELLKQYKDQIQEPDANEPDPVEDPQGYKEYIKAKVLKEEREERINDSRSNALEKYEDYLEKEKVFMFLASQDPKLVEKMNASNDPAKFAYDQAQTYQQEQREAIRAEIEAELKSSEEVKPSKAEVRKKNAVEMPDLTKAAAIGSNSEPLAKMPTLDDVLTD